MRILYVEDDPGNVHALERVAEYLKYELVVARTAAEGAELAQTGPDLILLDLGLPDRDGLTLARELRAAGIDVPIIAVSVGGLSLDKPRCLAAGCTDYVGKPFTFRQMCHYLSQYEAR